MVDNSTPADREQSALDNGWRAAKVLVTCVIVVLFAAAAYFVGRSDPWAERGGKLPPAFELDLGNQLAIDPAQIHYTQQTQLELSLDEVRAVAIGPDDRIFVAGDNAVHIHTGGGDRQKIVELEGKPSCLAVAGKDHVEPGRLYVGVADIVAVYAPDMKPQATWSVPAEEAEKAVLTSIAVAERDVFVADAGNRLVWRFDLDGQLLGRIGRPDESRQIPAFVVPSANFDVTVGAEDLIHIVNPGLLQVSTYSFEGDLGSSWGSASSALSGFFGCCNPAHIAMLPDGQFITSEKGIPRVKVYAPSGEFVSVVAGPRELGVNEAALGDPRFTETQSSFDVAVDSRGRVVVLDPLTKTVRVFVSKGSES